MADPMTDARLDEISALADAATPGPWTVEYDHDDSPYDHRFVSGVGPFVWVEHPAPYDAQDAEFVAAARTAVPELLVEVRRARAAEAEARAALNEAVHEIEDQADALDDHPQYEDAVDDSRAVAKRLRALLAAKEA